MRSEHSVFWERGRKESLRVRWMALSFVLFIGGCDPGASVGDVNRQTSERPIPVTIVQLKCNPHLYTGKVVKLIGFGLFDWETALVYGSREAAEYRDEANSIFVGGEYKSDGLDGVFVYVEATFVWNEEAQHGSLADASVVIPAVNYSRPSAD